MKIVKLDLRGLFATLLGAAPPTKTGDNALIKIVVQLIRKA